MDYTLHKITAKEELDTIVEVWFKARNYPYVPYSPIISPILGYTEEDQARALSASKERAWAGFLKSEESHTEWICVKHKSGQVVGGCQWMWMPGSPFPNGCPQVDMKWWPEGEQRDFVEEMLQQVMTPRSLWMQREHGGRPFTLYRVRAETS